MNREATFRKELRKNPNDILLVQAFADWLEEQGDERAAWVRDPLVWSWMRPGGKDPLPALKEHITRQTGKGSSARQAIVKLGTRGVQALLEALTELSSAQWPMIYEAEQAMGQLPAHSDALPTLIEASASPHLYVRRAAIMGLGALQRTQPQAHAHLIALVADPDLPIASWAACALKEADPISPTALPNLMKLISSFTEDQHFPYVYETIGKLGRVAEPAIPLLITTMQRRTDGKLHKALTQIGPAVIEPLLEALPQMTFNNHYYIAQILHELGPEVIEPMRKRLNDPNVGVAQVAASVLRKFDSMEGLPSLARALRQGSQTEKLAAAVTISQLSHRASELLPEMLAVAVNRQEAEGTRTYLLATIGCCQPREGSATALRGIVACRDEPVSVLRQAARTLDQLGYGATAILHALRQEIEASQDHRIMEALLSRYDSHSGIFYEIVDVFRPIRRNPTSAAGILDLVRIALDEPTEVALPALQTALQDDSLERRILAVVGLWHIREEKAIEGLLSAFQDRQRQVRYLAIAALGEIGSQHPDVLAAIKAARTDKARLVSDRAARIIGTWPG